MLVQTSRLLRLSLIAALAGATAWSPLFTAAAWAQDDDEEDSDEGDEGGGDDEGGGSEEEEEEEVEEDQPPVTAGGLFTKKTYPQGELQRPLTITKGLTELKAGIGFDISAKTAFETFGLSLDGRYGLEDNLELQGGFKGIYNLHQIDAYVAVEGSIVYDLVDFRGAARWSYCGPIENDMGVPEPYSPCTDPDAELHFDVGFPFRYAPKPQVAVVALDTFFTLDTESKPDLNPSVGVIVQPVPIVAILVKAQLLIPDFDTETKKFVVPATAAVQLSPTNLLDIGAEFTLLNIKPELAENAPAGTEKPGAFDQRFLLFYGQLRL
jgi:hypothetical protein